MCAFIYESSSVEKRSAHFASDDILLVEEESVHQMYISSPPIKTAYPKHPCSLRIYYIYGQYYTHTHTHVIHQDFVNTFPHEM